MPLVAPGTILRHSGRITFLPTFLTPCSTARGMRLCEPPRLGQASNKQPTAWFMRNRRCAPQCGGFQEKETATIIDYDKTNKQKHGIDGPIWSVDTTRMYAEPEPFRSVSAQMIGDARRWGEGKRTFDTINIPISCSGPGINLWNVTHPMLAIVPWSFHDLNTGALVVVFNARREVSPCRGYCIFFPH